MKKAIYFCSILSFLFLLVACNQKDSESVQGNVREATKKAEVTKDDFIYRLYSDNESYKQNETVKIIAELEYVGELDSITIFHAASPFYFDITEKKQGFTIDYPMNQPLLSTTLKKGEPLIEEYQKSGGFSEEEDSEYVRFMKQFFKEDGFPAGDYDIRGTAVFFVEDEERIDYELEATISFIVE